MKSLKEFLKHDNESSLVLKKLISNISNFYLHKDNPIINIGEITHSNKYKNLRLKINSGNDGLFSDSKGFFIQLHNGNEVIDHKSIEKFLKKEETVNKFVEFFSYYLSEKLFDNTKDDSEIRKDINYNFEDFYNTIDNTVKQFHKKYLDAKKHIDDNERDSHEKLGGSFNKELSYKLIKNDLLGKSSKEFTNKILSNFKNRIDLLSKENKEKLEKRLEDFFKSIE